MFFGRAIRFGEPTSPSKIRLYTGTGVPSAMQQAIAVSWQESAQSWALHDDTPHTPDRNLATIAFLPSLVDSQSNIW